MSAHGYAGSASSVARVLPKPGDTRSARIPVSVYTTLPASLPGLPCALMAMAEGKRR